MYGEDLAPYRYALLETCADHIHWAGGLWTDSREGKGKHGEAGGGHAHVGAMIYLGDNWPDLYRDNVFTCNIHGKRINRDRLERRGSGYVARHDRDFLMANDPWFRGLELKYGPDGAVYMTDWYDTGECHENDADDAHRENGRIYKISHGTPKPVTVDLASQDDEALAQLQLHHNDWFVRTARRLLQERAAAGRDLSKSHQLLRTILADNADVTRRLRAAWALYASGGLDEKAALAMLDQPSEHIRAWGVRLLCDSGSAVAGRRGAIHANGQDRHQPESSAEPGVGPSADSARSTMGGRRTTGEPQGRRVGHDAPLDDLVWSRAARTRRSATGRCAGVELRDSDRTPVCRQAHRRGRPLGRPGRRCLLAQGGNDKACADLLDRHARCASRPQAHQPPRRLARRTRRTPDATRPESSWSRPYSWPSISMIPRQPLYCGGSFATGRHRSI